MLIIETKSDLQKAVLSLKNEDKTIGFVPTMGSLHEGHISLIDIAHKHSNIVICSIYINPTQFNDKKDFELYPTNVENDIKMLEKAGCDIVFIPDTKAIYPNGIESINYDLGDLANVMEGKHRKGHFNGVIQVVKRLFDIVNPNIAVFGKKDFQQLAVINWMVNHFNLDIKIIGAPIVRDFDGLALSSRNARLSKNERVVALNLYKSLTNIFNNYKTTPLSELKTQEIERLSKIDNLELEYLEIADKHTLQSVLNLNNSKSLSVFIAAKVGNVRLIDNVGLF